MTQTIKIMSLISIKLLSYFKLTSLEFKMLVSELEDDSPSGLCYISLKTKIWNSISG